MKFRSGVIAFCLLVPLCLTLCGCGSAAAQDSVSSAAPEVSAQPTAAAPTESAAPAAETAAAAPTASPLGAQAESLSDILLDIYNNYHPGASGCALKALSCAGSLLDWYAAGGDDSAASAAGGSFSGAHDVSAGSEFPAKLLTVYETAMRLAFGRDRDGLGDAGYQPTAADSWTPQGTNAFFTALYAGLGLEEPQHVVVYYGDSNAENFLTAEMPADAVNEYAVLGALRTAGVVPEDTELNSFSQNGSALALDLGGGFREAVTSTGTAGERMILGGVTDTYLTAYGADSLLLTAGGATLETGHNIYDSPLTWYS